MLLRSLMFVPGHNEKLLKSAAKSSADVLLLDIEDSVQPNSNKQSARELIKEAIKTGLFSNHVIFPRVNDRESGELLKDIQQLTISGIEGFMYPKAKGGEDIYFFDKLLETIEYEKGINVGTFKIIPLIETAGAVQNADAICKSSKRVIAIAFGSEDYINDLKGVHDKNSESLKIPRAMIAIAARSNDVIPIDTVHIRVHDLEDLEDNLIYSKNLGFEGMLVLHPKEIPLVHKYYSPSESEVKDAREMIKLYRESEKSNKGVAIVNNKFVGPPFVRKAEQVLEKYQKILEKKL